MKVFKEFLYNYCGVGVTKSVYTLDGKVYAVSAVISYLLPTPLLGHQVNLHIKIFTLLAQGRNCCNRHSWEVS